MKEIEEFITDFLFYGSEVAPAHWQGINAPDKMLELCDTTLKIKLPTEDLEHYRQQVRPSVPWADDHFVSERVSGQPINPGTTWRQWPWGQAAARHVEGGIFNHTYAERYWPKLANDRAARGIRGPLGDLADVVRRLSLDPSTRQAVLSVWHPEDQNLSPGRRPCSLTYQFLMRQAHLNVIYSIRSCDIVRHFRDDIYLTIRLLLWVLDELRRADRLWFRVKPGTLTMHIGSLHCFVNDLASLKTLGDPPTENKNDGHSRLDHPDAQDSLGVSD